jgi:hypothetical protein
MSVDHLDGNAIAGLLREVFGSEMTHQAGCCRSCGTVSMVGAVHVFLSAPGVVMRCPACSSVLMVMTSIGEVTRVSVESLRWIQMRAVPQS